MKQNSVAAGTLTAVQTTVYSVLFAISFCHLLNDMMQSLLAALYPTLKDLLELNFTQIGLVSLVYQAVSSLLQPVVGLYTDRRAVPFLLVVGMASNVVGLLVLAVTHSYTVLLIAAACAGLGSAIFHPESARVVRMAASERHGLGQSLFQVGGNCGQALGPIGAAVIVLSFGFASIAWFAVMAFGGVIILWRVGLWYKRHGIARMKAGARRAMHELPAARVKMIFLVLLVLLFSKHVYIASINAYYTFYLIHHFGLTVRDAQFHLFMFLAAVAVGTLAGGILGDRFGRQYIIWFSVIGALPFSLLLPYADLFWTGMLVMLIGMILASAFPAILVYAQELVPGKVGAISGFFFGFSFGISGIGAAVLGQVADQTSIEFVYRICSFLPLLGLFAAFLPDLSRRRLEPV